MKALNDKYGAAIPDEMIEPSEEEQIANAEKTLMIDGKKNLKENLDQKDEIDSEMKQVSDAQEQLAMKEAENK